MTDPPAVATLVIPDCGVEYCPWEQFKTIALSKINIECTDEPLQSSLYAMMPAEDDSSEGSSCSMSEMSMVVAATVGGYSLLLAIIVWGLVFSGAIVVSRPKSASYAPYETVENAEKNEALVGSSTGGGVGASYVPPVTTNSMHTGNESADVKV